ncbi:unnamed protein product [Protopolystoma xenopodis]|uniref:Uncharacterized protein n=1 Tax=Protopolystoma xenopodis TaxID=117903 RepID=A0A448WG38_9PLAT|nr:unnamed protein product [Protopolystoma xenopodis]
MAPIYRLPARASPHRTSKLSKRIKGSRFAGPSTPIDSELSIQAASTDDAPEIPTRPSDSRTALKSSDRPPRGGFGPAHRAIIPQPKGQKTR